MKRTAIAAVSWGPDRLDVFGLGQAQDMFHKAWLGHWYPSQYDWEPLGGICTSPPAAVSWGPNRLDIFVRGAGTQMHHKAWDGDWRPSETEWEPIGLQNFHRASAPGGFYVFAIGSAFGEPGQSLKRKSWDGGWRPAGTEFYFWGESPVIPALVSLGPDQLRLFGSVPQAVTEGDSPRLVWSSEAYDLDKGMCQSALSVPTANTSTPLGGAFDSPPVAVSWGPGRLPVLLRGIPAADAGSLELVIHLPIQANPEQIEPWGAPGNRSQRRIAE